MTIAINFTQFLAQTNKSAHRNNFIEKKALFMLKNSRRKGIFLIFW